MTKISATRIGNPQQRQKTVTQSEYVQLTGNPASMSSGRTEMFVPLTHSMRRSGELP
jgi:hypothetical protein